VESVNFKKGHIVATESIDTAKVYKSWATALCIITKMLKAGIDSQNEYTVISS